MSSKNFFVLNDVDMGPLHDRKWAMLSTDNKFLYIFGGRKKTWEIATDNANSSDQQHSTKCPCGKISEIAHFGLAPNVYCYDLDTGTWYGVKCAELQHIGRKFANRLSGCSTCYPLPSVFLFSDYADLKRPDPEKAVWELYMLAMKGGTSATDEEKVLVNVERLKITDLDGSRTRLYQIEKCHLHLVSSADTNDNVAVNNPDNLCLYVLANSKHFNCWEEEDEEKWTDRNGKTLFYVFKLWKENDANANQCLPNAVGYGGTSAAAEWNWKCITPKPFKMRQSEQQIMVSAGATFDNPNANAAGDGNLLNLHEWMDIFDQDEIYSFIHGGRLCMLGKGRTFYDHHHEDDANAADSSNMLIRAREKMLICHLDSGEFELAAALPDPNNGFPPYRQSGQSILVGDNFYLLPWLGIQRDDGMAGFIFTRTIWKFNIIERIWLKLPGELKFGADDDDIFGPSNSESNDFYSAVVCDNGQSWMLFNNGKICKVNIP